MRTCVVEGCEKPAKKRRLICGMHIHRLERHGDVDYDARPGAQPGSVHNFKGDDAGYFAVHKRLRTQFGNADTHACADCAKPARYWAFDEPTGFSTDLTRYRPLCGPCHAGADRGAGFNLKTKDKVTS